MFMADALWVVAMAHSINRERRMNRMNDDTISRQAAIDGLAKLVPYVICDESTESYTEGLSDAYNLICQLPSAERLGRWMENEFGAYCSECGLYAYRSNGIPWKSNYCQICGASMMDANATQHTECVGDALDALEEVEE